MRIPGLSRATGAWLVRRLGNSCSLEGADIRVVWCA